MDRDVTPNGVEGVEDLLDEVTRTLQGPSHTHYGKSGDAWTRARLRELYDLVAQAVSTGDLAPLSLRSAALAEERFMAGFEIHEVQTAFNALEAAMWQRVVASTPPAELAGAIGRLSSVVGAGKDIVARTYVALAVHHHRPCLDTPAMFGGTVG